MLKIFDNLLFFFFYFLNIPPKSPFFLDASKSFFTYLFDVKNSRGFEKELFHLLKSIKVVTSWACGLVNPATGELLDSNLIFLVVIGLVFVYSKVDMVEVVVPSPENGAAVVENNSILSATAIVVGVVDSVDKTVDDELVRESNEDGIGKSAPAVVRGKDLDVVGICVVACGTLLVFT